MRALVLFAHAVTGSVSSALHDSVFRRPAERGWSMNDCDLHAEGFGAVLAAAERGSYHDEKLNCATVKECVLRPRAAEILALALPVWIFGSSAILKGFFDRTCVPSGAFKLLDGKVKPNLTQICKLAAATTYGWGYAHQSLWDRRPAPPSCEADRAFCCQPEKRIVLHS